MSEPDHDADDRPTVHDTDGVRASDTEREETVAALHAALGEGRLDVEETSTRADAASTARFRHELPPLLDDLPGPSGSRWEPPHRGGATGAGAGTTAAASGTPTGGTPSGGGRDRGGRERPPRRGVRVAAGVAALALAGAGGFALGQTTADHDGPSSGPEGPTAGVGAGHHRGGGNGDGGGSGGADGGAPSGTGTGTGTSTTASSTPAITSGLWT